MNTETLFTELRKLEARLALKITTENKDTVIKELSEITDVPESVFMVDMGDEDNFYTLYIPKTNEVIYTGFTTFSISCSDNEDITESEVKFELLTLVPHFLPRLGFV